ncbi:MAG: DUF488 domain-containing protein [Patescibacteria group bacterium]|nr:DUF488 domain-containing protein [Patescibacteria group bacterium]
MTTIHLKRVYEPASTDDGYRILVDRLWPRGVSKEKARIDYWEKGVTPSPALRTWFGHDPRKWHEFSRRYREELEKNSAAVDAFKKIISKEPVVTFVYGAKDTEHTHAIVLKEFIESTK